MTDCAVAETIGLSSGRDSRAGLRVEGSTGWATSPVERGAAAGLVTSGDIELDGAGTDVAVVALVCATVSMKRIASDCDRRAVEVIPVPLPSRRTP